MPDGNGALQPTQQSSVRSAVLFAFVVAACVALVVLTVRILLVLFAGILFATVLHAVASFLARHTRAPYKAIVAACVLLLIAGTALGIYLSVPALTSQLHGLGTTLPQAVDKLRHSLRLPPLASVTAGAKAPDWGSNLEKIATHALTAVGTTVELFGGLVVFFFVGLYGALEPDSYARVLLWCVPSTKKRRVRRILDVTTENLRRWLLGRLVAMTFVGVASGIAFAVLHVPLALPLAVLAGALTFVEYVGAFASALPPVLLAFSESPNRALWVMIVFAVLHVIEGYVLTPLLARSAVRFPPASTLASQALFSAVLGPLGLTFATPLLIVGVTALQEWRKGDVSS